jgi:rare lipoprotein A
MDESQDGIHHVQLCRDIVTMNTARTLLIGIALAGLLHGCALVQETPRSLGTASPGAAMVKPSPPKLDKPQKAEIGHASWYGPRFHGKKTASGDVFDQTELTAAHRNLPLGSKVRVTNLENERSVEVKINDRGPFIAGRIIDLSHAAARALGMVEDGLARVRLELLSLPGEAKS